MTSIFEKLKLGLRHFLTNQICVWNGSTFASVNGVQESLHNDAKPVVIVPRRLCFEMSKNYKIANSKDLTKAIELEAPSLSPFKSPLFFYSITNDVDSSLVHFWFIEKEKLPSLNRVLVIIPESLLAFVSSKNNQQIHGLNLLKFDSSSLYWQWIGNKHFVSHWREDRCLELVKQLTESNSTVVNSHPDYYDFVLSALPQLLLHRVNNLGQLIGTFVLSSLRRLEPKNLKIPALIAAAFVVLQSTYLYGMQLVMDYKAQEIGVELKTLFKKQSQLLNAEKNLLVIQSAQSSELKVSSQLAILAETLNGLENVNIGQISSENGELRLHIRAANANDVQSAINQNSKVSSTEIVGGIRTVGRNKTEQEFRLAIQFGLPQ